MKLKIELTTKDGLPFGLKADDLVEVVFPNHVGNLIIPVNFLEETDAFDVSLTKFQLNGFKEGPNQTFWANLKRGNRVLTFEFLKALTVESSDGQKSIQLGA